MDKLPIYELFLDNDDELSVALVDYPAIETNFVYFSEDKKIEMIFNEEQMIVKGPALIPNKLIYRDDYLGERYVYFTQETIMNFVTSFLKKSENKFNLQHSDQIIDLDIVESYFATERNEFDVPVGSWILSAKVNSPEIWQLVKRKFVNGFSIEGYFLNKLTPNKFNKNNNMDIKEKLLEFINSVLFNEEVKVEDVVEDVVEEVKVEDVVEDVVEEVKVEDVVEEVKVEDVIEETDKFASEITRILDEKLLKFKEEIENKINELDVKLEKFGNEPIPTDNKHIDVQNPVETVNPASKFFRK